MKTKITLTGLLLAGSLLSQNANAQQVVFQGSVQQTIQRLNEPAPHHRLYYSHVLKLSGTANKTTANEYNLKGVTFSEYQGNAFVRRDTTFYIYSNDRRGVWNGDMNYDKAIIQKYDATGSNFTYDRMVEQRFNAAGSDTERVFSEWDDNMTMYNVKERDFYVFNSMNWLTSMQHQMWNAGNWSNDTLYEFSYDTASQKVIAMEGKVWNTTGNYWTPSFRYAYTYVNGDMASETLEYWDATALTWKGESRYKYLYNNGNMISATYQVFNPNGSNWVDQEKTSYTYNTSGQVTESLVQDYNVGLSNWENNLKYMYTLDTDGDVLSEVMQTWNNAGAGSYDNVRRTNMIYNTAQPDNHMPMMIETEFWDGANWAYNNNSTQYRLYFEEIINSVNNITKVDAQVYPSPASDVINIKFNWNKSEPISITMFDAQGRVVKQWNDQANGQYSKQVSVNELPSGNYWLRITGSSAVSNKQIAVIH